MKHLVTIVCILCFCTGASLKNENTLDLRVSKNTFYVSSIKDALEVSEINDWKIMKIDTVSKGVYRIHYKDVRARD